MDDSILQPLAISNVAPTEHKDVSNSSASVCSKNDLEFQNDLSSFDKVFETIEIWNDSPLCDESPSECVFLSVHQKEVTDKTVQTLPSLPKGLQKYCLPRSEVSLLLSLCDDQIDKYRTLVLDSPQKEKIYETLKRWLFGNAMHVAESNHSVENFGKELSRAKDTDSGYTKIDISASEFKAVAIENKDSDHSSSSILDEQNNAIKDDSIENATVSSISNSNCKNICCDLEPKTKPRTIFNVSCTDLEKIDSVKTSKKPDYLSKRDMVTIINSSPLKEAFCVKEHVLKAAIPNEIVASPTLNLSLGNESSSPSISLSSSTSNVAEFENNLEKETDVEVPVVFDLNTPLQQHKYEKTLKNIKPRTTNWTAPPVPDLGLLRRQSSVESILVRASNSLKNNTSVWCSFDDDAFVSNDHEGIQVEKSLFTSLNESLISDYRPLDETNPYWNMQQARPSVEQRLSYDSLERRKKFQRRSRKKWLQQQPMAEGPVLPFDVAEMISSPKTPTKAFDCKENFSHISISHEADSADCSSPFETYLTPTAPPESRQQSVEFDEEVYYTPITSNVHPQLTNNSPDTICSSQKPLVRNLDATDEFLSAPATPVSLEGFPSKEFHYRTSLPPLPKIPYLEAISPTGSAPGNGYRACNKYNPEKKLKPREVRVREIIEKVKAETRRRKNAESNSVSPSNSDKTIKSISPIADMNDEQQAELQWTTGRMPEVNHAEKCTKKGNSEEKSPPRHVKFAADYKEKDSEDVLRIIPRKKQRKKSKKSQVDVDVVDGIISTDVKKNNKESAAKYWRQESWASLSGLTPEQISAKITRRVQMVAKRQAKRDARKRLKRTQMIQQQLKEVEAKHKLLEEREDILEKLLCDDGEDKESDHMQEWFKIVEEKNELFRWEIELMANQRELQLEDVQGHLQQELRERMAKDNNRKTSSELAQEKEILRKMMDVVEQRNELVALIDEQKSKNLEDTIDADTLMMNKLNLISIDANLALPIA